MEKHEIEAEQKFQIKGLKILSTYDVYNMIVSALEGGSNYWYFITDESVKAIYNSTSELIGEPFVDRMLIAIKKGIEVEIKDIESGEFLGRLTSKSWAKAEELMLKNHKKHLGNILLGDDDAITADVFFQLAVIGELTYG